jgi:hypothetical protein
MTGLCVDIYGMTLVTGSGDILLRPRATAAIDRIGGAK